MEQKRFEVT